MKFFIIFFCSILYAFSLSASQKEGTLQQVLDLHTEAMGGKEVIENIQSVQIDLTIEEPEFTVDAVYVADRNIRMRIDIYVKGKRVFTEAYDGEKAWEMGEDGKAKDTSVQGTAALRTGIYLPGKFFGLHELSKLGHSLLYEGQQKVDDQSYHVLKLAFDTGKETVLYIHPETGFVERTRDVVSIHPDIDPAKKATETKNSDFRKVGSTTRSFQAVQKDLKTGKVLQTITVKEFKPNPKLEDSLFRKPS